MAPQGSPAGPGRCSVLLVGQVCSGSGRGLDRVSPSPPSSRQNRESVRQPSGSPQRAQKDGDVGPRKAKLKPTCPESAGNGSSRLVSWLPSLAEWPRSAAFQTSLDQTILKKSMVVLSLHAGKIHRQKCLNTFFHH